MVATKGISGVRLPAVARQVQQREKDNPMWMNEYDVDEAVRLFDANEVPNLARGATTLANLVRWTNSNSDGWPYWSKPSNAAKSLQTMLSDRTYAARFGHDRQGRPLSDVTKPELDKALRPVKAFLTRQGVDHDMILAK